MIRSDIHSPWGNLRAIERELVLLETHIADPELRCDRCIGRHLVAAEALGLEAVRLAEGAAAFVSLARQLLAARRWYERHGARVELLGPVRRARVSVQELRGRERRM